MLEAMAMETGLDAEVWGYQGYKGCPWGAWPWPSGWAWGLMSPVWDQMHSGH